MNSNFAGLSYHAGRRARSVTSTRQDPRRKRGLQRRRRAAGDVNVDGGDNKDNVVGASADFATASFRVSGSPHRWTAERPAVGGSKRHQQLGNNACTARSRQLPRPSPSANRFLKNRGESHSSFVKPSFSRRRAAAPPAAASSETSLFLGALERSRTTGHALCRWRQQCTPY